MTRSPFTLLLAAATVALTAMLSGCAAAPPIEASTATALQAGVLEVATAASTGDVSAARSQLSSLEGRLRTAAASGQVTAERSASIQSAINLVGAELDTAINEAQAKAEAEAQAAADAAAAAVAAETEQAAADAAAQAAADAAAAAENAKDEDRSKGDDCKGKDCSD